MHFNTSRVYFGNLSSVTSKQICINNLLRPMMTYTVTDGVI